jgi:hypothetical protein
MNTKDNGKMEMDQESIQLCRRLESNMNGIMDVQSRMQSSMTAVLHLLRGNELDDSTGLISQIREMRLDRAIQDKKDEENKKIMFEKMSADKVVLENKIELLKMQFEARLVKVEKWKDKVIYMAIGAGIGGGIGIKALIDLITKSK